MKSNETRTLLVGTTLALAMCSLGLFGAAYGLRVWRARVEGPLPPPPITPTSLPAVSLPPSAPASLLTTPTGPQGTGEAYPGPAFTPTPSPTTTPPLTPTPTSTPTPAGLSLQVPYNGPLRAGNGPDIYVPRLTQPPALDGDLSDWAGVPFTAVEHVVWGAQNYEGRPDLAGLVYLGWDTRALYLAARVVDDRLVQESSGALLYRGDSLELWLDLDLGGDFEHRGMNRDDYHIGLSPGNFRQRGPEAIIWFPPVAEHTAAVIQLAAAQWTDGWTLEAAIPWSLLDIAPQEGLVFGGAVNIGDNDSVGHTVQETVRSTTPRYRWNDPTTFGNVFLRGNQP